jgi:hypothetical protein
MSDTADDYRAMAEHRKALRVKYGIACPECVRLRPKTNAKILLPQGRCRMHGLTDARPDLTDAQLADV